MFGPLRRNGHINLVWDSSLSSDGIWKGLEWQVDFRMRVSTSSSTSRSTDDAAQSIFPSSGPCHAAMGLQIGNGVGADLLRRRDGVILACGDQRALRPFLIGLFAVGCGASMLETAANPFIAQFGFANTSERRLNFSQSFNPPGTMIAWFNHD